MKTVLTQDDDHDMLRAFLDSTLVCYQTASRESQDETLATDFAAFSQQSFSATGSSLEEGTVLQSEVCRVLDVSLSPFLREDILLRVLSLCSSFDFL